MTVVYLDTSALLKRYVAETGSAWVRSYLTSQAILIFTSTLSIVESTCAFARRLREGTLSENEHALIVWAFDYDVTHRYNLLEVAPATIDTARRLAYRHPLRAYDAVQLATAWLLNQELRRVGETPLMFLCADDRLIAVAQAEGLLTENPTHPS